MFLLWLPFLSVLQYAPFSVTSLFWMLSESIVRPVAYSWGLTFPVVIPCFQLLTSLPNFVCLEWNFPSNFFFSPKKSISAKAVLPVFSIRYGIKNIFLPVSKLCSIFYFKCCSVFQHLELGYEVSQKEKPYIRSLSFTVTMKIHLWQSDISLKYCSSKPLSRKWLEFTN